MKIFNLMFALLIAVSLQAKTYYVNPTVGDDTNRGTSMAEPFKTLDRASHIRFKGSDTILLSSTSGVHRGSLELEKVDGVYVDSYGNGTAKIDAAGYLNGILIKNSKNITVNNISITADGGGVIDQEITSKMMRCGVLVTTSKKGEVENIILSNLEIKDIFFEELGFTRGKEEVKTANGSQNYGWGIRVINGSKESTIKNITVKSSKISNVAHTGIKFTGGKSLDNITVINNRVEYTGGPGMQASRVTNALFDGNDVYSSGNASDSRKWGRGSGLWTWGSSNVMISNNRFEGANGPGDSAGCHIDFNCNDVIVQYNFSKDNAGGFCEILGNNYNCCYRYNISVNDGYRKKGDNGAFQEGKVFWLSGFVGKDTKRFGPINSYFYNNTVYVDKNLVAKVAIDKAVDGVLIANNIFYIVGDSKQVLGDQYRPESDGPLKMKHILFKNNLFLHQKSWPTEMAVADIAPTYGDPKFIKNGGSRIKDYTPKNSGLIQNRGITIPMIPNDTIGIKIGLKVKFDILGNRVTGAPDMGAIEL